MSVMILPSLTSDPQSPAVCSEFLCLYPRTLLDRRTCLTDVSQSAHLIETFLQSKTTTSRFQAAVPTVDVVVVASMASARLVSSEIALLASSPTARRATSEIALVVVDVDVVASETVSRDLTGPE